jgi:hypothetical protein
MITEVKAAFARDHAEILGGFLDALVKALRVPKPEIPRSFRMADFASWACRLAEPLGLAEGELLDAYARNVEQQAEEAVRADITGEVLLDILEDIPEKRWQGPATELLSNLRTRAEELHASSRQRNWPKSSTVLGKKVRILKDSLGKIGYKVDFTRSMHGGKRIIIIEYQAGTPASSHKLGKVSTDTSLASPTSPMKVTGDSGDSRDTIVGSFPERNRVLATLRAIAGPFSLDYAVERAIKVTNDKTRAEKTLKLLQDEGLVIENPNRYLEVIR